MDEDRRQLYVAVSVRANSHCEACGKEHHNRAEFDHWLGGSGRRRQMESEATVWLLCLACHRARTDNRPHAGYWNDLFRAHCQRHGLPFVAHKDLRDILGEAGIGRRR